MLLGYSSKTAEKMYVNTREKTDNNFEREREQESEWEYETETVRQSEGENRVWHLDLRIVFFTPYLSSISI